MTAPAPIVRPRLLVTMGDVAGVGPEIIARAWPDLNALCRPVGYTDRALVDALSDELKQNDYRIRPLIQAIVASEPFNTK